MRYLLILLIILGFTGCRQETANFSNSLNIVEQNQLLIEKRGGIKQDILDIQEIQNQRNQEIIHELQETSSTPPAIPASQTPQTSPTPPAIQASPAIPASPTIPAVFNLPVKFAPQSPFATWDDLHQEACEEAAMIMAVKYLKNENLDKQIMEHEIQKLVKWETDNGYEIDVTAQETVEILKDYFELKAEVTNEVTIERIKKELATGNLIITPHAGRELGNPYYRQPGPLYHFLIIRGWTESEFITNDPGTKRGDGFKYKFDKLIETVHDWNEGNIKDGERAMVVVGIDDR